MQNTDYFMHYNELHTLLKNAFDKQQNSIEIENLQILKFSFASKSYSLLPGPEKRYCQKHDLYFSTSYDSGEKVNDGDFDVNVKDIEVPENIHFPYFIILPKGVKKVKRLVLLFHGFNEKSWDKYLPWAGTIAEKLNCGVLLFPIAFHMHRAPSSWSDKRSMFQLSNIRKKQFPDVIHSTLSNAAMSVRMQSLPQRFIWSGLQTYYDVIQLVEELRGGENSYVDKDFDLDIFAYSIGGFLGEILLLSNYNNYFKDSKLCLFCSGPVFNRLSPVSKFILDSKANVALYSYLVEHFNAYLKKDDFLNHFMNGEHVEGKVFRSMLEYKTQREYRESLFEKFKDQIYAIALKKDEVIPPFEVFNTLHGAYNDIAIHAEEMDFPFDYSHETPFPLTKKLTAEVSEAYKDVFARVCDFLGGEG